MGRIMEKGSVSTPIFRTSALVASALALIGVADSAQAAGWAPSAITVSPTVNLGIPSPDLVPGKEYSDHSDKNDLGFFDLDQVLAWDGIFPGGTADSWDYSGSRLLPGAPLEANVDALAASGDALYQPVTNDQVALLFSVGDLGVGGPIGDGNIYVEPATAGGGAPATTIWADPSIIDRNGVTDLDALEVWGSNASPTDDAKRYSIYGDPFVEIAPSVSAKVAIWQYNSGANTSLPHTLTADLAMAMDRQYGFNGLGPVFGQLVELMDVDATMVFGDQVMFSIAPLDLSVFSPLLPNFDGGEIFVYDGPGSTTRFLDHGGHLWDTAFDIVGTFGPNGLGLPIFSENINALEAVATPEPASAVLLTLALAGTLRRR
ncbi:MAG: hypothetical protein RLN76_13770 [Phycisphaeraceae bacterium]